MPPTPLAAGEVVDHPCRAARRLCARHGLPIFQPHVRTVRPRHQRPHALRVRIPQRERTSPFLPLKAFRFPTCQIVRLLNLDPEDALPYIAVGDAGPHGLPVLECSADAHRDSTMTRRVYKFTKAEHAIGTLQNKSFH